MMKLHGRTIRSIAALSAASLFAQPLMVAPGAQACASQQITGVGTNAVSAPCAIHAPEMMAPALPLPYSLLSIALLPITALSPAMIETQRGAIEQIMIELGEDEDQAHQMATELTAEDLAVLLANPKMMRKAGDLEMILVAVLIVGGIVALALAADSAVIISN